MLHKGTGNEVQLPCQSQVIQILKEKFENKSQSIQEQQRVPTEQYSEINTNKQKSRLETLPETLKTKQMRDTTEMKLLGTKNHRENLIGQRKK